jgi:SAM-dependent methyltransferase
VGWQAVEGSYRDPSGFVFTRDGILYRQINNSFRERFDAFLSSGLYDELVGEGLLVPHEQVGRDLAATDEAYTVIRPERVDFISYPYEWSFGQLRDAALLTLTLQDRALRRGFVLRDASAYNVQFRQGRPIFIDTLSFEPREEGAPWVAYRQFCEHFLVPLLLMSRRDVRCGQLLRSSLDGIPLALGSRMLPVSSWLRPATLLHVHAHAKAQTRYADTAVPAGNGRPRQLSREALLALGESLRRAIEKLDWTPAGTEWAEYANDNSYAADSAAAKRDLVRRLLAQHSGGIVWDLGANTGEYSRVASERADLVVSFDIDPAAVERNYRRVKSEHETAILPLLLDLANPSPAQGWAHTERLSLEQRGPADTVLALALVHHLAIGRNLPLESIASYLSRLGDRLVIEFVPKEDSQVQRLLRHRADVFPGYTVAGFEDAFRRHFRIDSVHPIAGTDRSVYLMTSCRKRDAA